jgi:hypothetical protein
VAALRSAEQRRDALRNELAATENQPALEALSSLKLEARLVARAKEWRSVLAQDVPLARALKALLAGPISLQREGGGYKLRGSTRIGALWAPESGLTKMASPRGFEPRLPP